MRSVGLEPQAGLRHSGGGRQEVHGLGVVAVGTQVKGGRARVVANPRRWERVVVHRQIILMGVRTRIYQEAQQDHPRYWALQRYRMHGYPRQRSH